MEWSDAIASTGRKSIQARTHLCLMLLYPDMRMSTENRQSTYIITGSIQPRTSRKNNFKIVLI